jgi:cytochrome c5
MPPRGGLSALSDEQLRAAVANMLNLSGANGGEEH